MPLNPQYVQTISKETVPGGMPGRTFQKKDFVNTSSQMADPGMLPRFFGQQNEAYPMPFVLSDIPISKAPIKSQLSEANNVSNLPKVATLPEEFKNNVDSKLVRFRTDSMRAFGVPLGMTELRATDAMY